MPETTSAPLCSCCADHGEPLLEVVVVLCPDCGQQCSCEGCVADAAFVADETKRASVRETARQALRADRLANAPAVERRIVELREDFARRYGPRPTQDDAPPQSGQE